MTTPLSIQVSECPGYRNSRKASSLLKRGWRRCFVTVYETQTGEKVVSNLVYLPPAANTEVLEKLMELWAV